MTLQVEISKQNTKQIINAIKLLKGVKNVSKQGFDKKRVFREVKESKADREAWIRARRDLERGETVSHEELKKKYDL